MWPYRRIQTHMLAAIAILWLIDDSVKTVASLRHKARSAGLNDHHNVPDSLLRNPRRLKKPQQNPKVSNQGNTRKNGSSGRTTQNSVIVRLEKGKYRGKIIDILGNRVGTFLGMRYGQSAAGNMRFKKAKPVTRWGGVRDAYEYSNSCYQWIDNTFGKGYPGTEMWNPNTKVNEDCLFINVWTPLGSGFHGSKVPNHGKLLPVMVWIYGGGFYSGTSSLDVYQGQWMAASEEVVVVSMNYRVAAFGFLTFGTKDAPGNVGLWDQNLALQWVHENIRAFRGDKTRITLFGESAGAASVTMHMLSEKSNKLFKNAIIQSASVLSPWSLISKSEMKSRAVKLAEKLNCTQHKQENKSLSDTLSCLKKKDAKVIVDEEISLTDLGTARFQNAAIVDKEFLSEDAINELQNGSFSTNINILGGFNGNEGNYFLVYTTEGFSLDDKIISYSQYRKGLNRGLWGYPWAPYDENYQKKYGENSSEIILEAIDFQYTDLKKTWSDRRYSPYEPSKHGYKAVLDHIVGDSNFVCPTIEFLKKTLPSADIQSELGSGGKERQASKGRKYLYRFLHRSSRTPWPEWMGTLHGYEIEFAFGIPLNRSLNYTDQEVDLSKRMLKYWANFAKTSDPNRGSLEKDSDDERTGNLTHWPQYDDKTGASLVFDIKTTNESNRVPITNLYVEVKSKDRHCKFWNDYYPALSQRAHPLGNCCEPCPVTSSADSASISLFVLITIIVETMYVHM